MSSLSNLLHNNGKQDRSALLLMCQHIVRMANTAFMEDINKAQLPITCLTASKVQTTELTITTIQQHESVLVVLSEPANIYATLQNCVHTANRAKMTTIAAASFVSRSYCYTV